ncbi:MAG: hypothetical protein HYW02_07575 [Deltaproteobacteria bacterium]|nr:hypothetical protein [Deltaproteobacteria bacterium]MBI2501298.1 hypothetical protein [Deltaproteobacteria bacterium]
MNQIRIDANRVKFEARNNPPPEVAEKGSKFWRFMRGFSALAAPVGFASSAFFPPAALIGASAYGLGQFGSYKDSTKKAEHEVPYAPYYPGLNTPAGGPVSAPMPLAIDPVQDPINIIVNRQEVANDMIGRIR